jgi:acyl transferase domain-containing protein
MHSSMTDALVPVFTSRVAAVERRRPTVPFVSTVTGRRADEEITFPAYWGRQLREPVKFRDAVSHLTEGTEPILLEVGPGDVLARLAESCVNNRAVHRPVTISSHGPRQAISPAAGFAAAVGRLWAAGCPIDWDVRFRSNRRRKLQLPTYPFERRRYMLDLPRTAAAVDPASGSEGREAELPRSGSEAHSPATTEPEAHAGIVAEIEAEVVSVWRKLLGVEVIERDRSFFAWSDSLGANRLVARLRDLFGTVLPLARFYEDPTVKGCVAIIREELAGDLAALGGERNG